MSNSKVDLSVLKRMVSELESSVQRADEISVTTKDGVVDRIVELNKATGLAAGILTEAGLLMGDIQHLVAGSAATDASNKDFVAKVLGGFKGPGGTN